MINGRYTIYKGGAPIAVSDNLVTSTGKEVIKRFIAGEFNRWVSHIVTGVSDKVPAASNSYLDFELSRSEVSAMRYVPESDTILLRSTVPQNVIGEIRELGTMQTVVSSEGTSNMFMLSEFVLDIGDYENFVSVDARRIDESAARVDADGNSTTIATINTVNINLSGIWDRRGLSLAYDAMSNIQEVEIRFTQGDNNYLSHTFTPDAGYNFEQWKANEMTIVGDADLHKLIRDIEIHVTATASAGSIVFDGLSVMDDDISEGTFLISRSLLDTPIFKTDDSPLEIEYEVSVGW